MKKINKNSMIFSLKILFVFAFGLIFIPFDKAVAAPSFVPGHYNADESYTFGDFSWSKSVSTDNPMPTVNSISPKSSNMDVNAQTITVIGRNFVPSSVVRINDFKRSATFIDDSHLLVQINNNDLYAYRANDGFFISVFNGFPGGGYSNAVFFTINNPAAYSTAKNNINYGNNYPTQTGNATDNNANQNYGNLASNVIFGSNSFLPSGLIQWVLLAIIILVIIILARKIFSARKNYDETPMKHA